MEAEILNDTKMKLIKRKAKKRSCRGPTRSCFGFAKLAFFIIATTFSYATCEFRTANAQIIELNRQDGQDLRPNLQPIQEETRAQQNIVGHQQASQLNVSTQPPTVTTELSNKPTTTIATTTSLSIAATTAAEIPTNVSLKGSTEQEIERHLLEVADISRIMQPPQAPLAPPPPTDPPTKSAPVLRPSIEEVASELSRKYLNLERHRQQAAAAAASSTPAPAPLQQEGISMTLAGGERDLALPSVSKVSSVDDAEHEIVLKQTLPTAANESNAKAGQPEAKTAARSQSSGGGGGNFLAATNNNNEGQYLQIDAVAQSSSQRPAASQTTNRNKRPVSMRRKKANSKKNLAAHLQQQHQQEGASFNEDSELSQCQRYLQHHSTAYQALVSSAPSLAQVASASKFSHSASQLLPCSCQQTNWHFAAVNSLAAPLSASLEAQLNIDQSSVWLNCDYIQLIGSQLFTPTPMNGRQQGSRANTNNTRRSSDGGDDVDVDDLDDTGGTGTGVDDDGIGGGLLTKFSQRDAGLQILFSQKFHYLQLSSLKSIDLSQNRLRQIKMDAFHGLENTLEFLNLAHNLLGDSRALFAAEPSGNGELGARPNDAPGSASGNSNGWQHSPLTTSGEQLPLGASINNQNGRLIFISDELNRLKKLKWLSLQNNQLNQLGSNVFIQTPSSNQHHHHYHNQQQLYNNKDQNEARRATSELLFLDLSDNLLKSVPSEAIQFLDKLQVLKLKNNRIIQLDQTSKFPQSLRHLDLSENLISIIRHNDLIDLPHLSELNLSNNQLRHLDQTAFVSARSLIAPPSSASFLQPSQQAGHGPPPKDDGGPQQPDQTQRLDQAGSDFKALGEQSAISAADDYDGGVSRWSQSRAKRDLVSGQSREVEETNDSTGGEVLEAEESGSLGVGSEPGQHHVDNDDLETDESIFSAITSRLKGRGSTAQQLLSEDLSMVRVTSQFNSTLKLNLSHNFFEEIPGDSLLKFSQLQSLDFSYNRVRKLDSNYLCSIYNLVDNLRYLDLSGNLLHSNQRTIVNNDNQRHLNKLFGCLQRLEKLLLSTNRLASISTTTQPASSSSGAASDSSTDHSPSSEQPNRPTATQDDAEVEFIQTEDEGQSMASRREDRQDTMPQNARLVVKFGDNHGNKQLTTLDLSDNQLRVFPLFELASQPSLVLSSSSASDMDANNSAANQAKLNEWMNSRVRLEVLNLNYNYLERLDIGDLEHLQNLRKFHLNFNKLTALPAKIMRRFTSLDELSLAGNRIGSLEPLHQLFERCMKTLKSLNLANNRLMTWPQSTVPASASSSSQLNHQLVNPQSQSTIGGADFSVMSEHHDLSTSAKRQQLPIDFALEELNLEGNLLTSINVTSLFDQLIYMKSLRSLNLSYNLLNKVQSEWFKFANTNLQRLSLTGNKINNIDMGAFALNQVNELIQLNLDYNLLKELKRKTFESMPKIRELSLAHNLIHTINSETFHQLNSLQVLKLNNNKLTSWKCEYFSHLCNSISGNINVDLATLITSHHQKPEHPLSQSQSILSGQHQQTATGGGAVSSLVELDLSHNSLSQLRANSISVHTKLAKLDLSHNKLSFIPHDLFKATTTIQSGGRQIHLVSSLKYLNLAHNRIQTIDNINFKPLKNLLSLDLSFNELQSLGVDVITLEAQNAKQESATRRVFVSNNLTSLLLDNDSPADYHQQQRNHTGRSARSLYSTSSWPALSKLRHLNLSHNTLSLVNQSLLSELSPFVALNLDLSYNYLDSETLPAGFFTKVSSSSSNFMSRTGEQAVNSQQASGGGGDQQPAAASQEPSIRSNYDLVFTLKIESLDLSHNRLGEWPAALLDNHHSSMELCNLSHNRIQNLPQNSNPMIQIKSLNLEFNPLSRESSELVLAERRSTRHLNLAATRLYAIQQATAEGSQYSSSMPNHLKTRLVNQTSQLDLIRSISKPIEGPYLKHLNLSSNQLVWLSANVFDRMHSLQTLDLSNNQLTRLHLLSNQLNQVSTSLEYLYLGSNLFTSIDATDFNQLSRLRNLDLRNLLSLQKLDCRFLSKLSTLRRLRMFNYPQLRQRLNNIVADLFSTRDPQLITSERYQQKLREELVMSTIGGHCFQDISRMHASSGESPTPAYEQNWFKLEQVELELFNNYQQPVEHLSINNKGPRSQGSFQLTDELRQLLGPQTNKLTLFGLNLTMIADDSLLGITGDHLDLKISYTSIANLPLRQILTSLAKRTKLRLDLRNNNIQTIDMEALQWLDELQQINQANFNDIVNRNAAIDSESGSSLRLASNPFRCDCQTRPLWLWLNQRWDNIDEYSQISDDQIGETSTGNNANYWLKFNTISQASDLKCFYPAKLRGRPAQHVSYNDLVCKGASLSSVPTSSGAGRQMRKRNETSKASDSYYMTSSLNDFNDMDDLDDEDYIEMHFDSSSSQIGMIEPVVRITRFNRYPSATSNSTNMYFLNNFPTVPLVPDKAELPVSDDSLDVSNRIGKRDYGGTSRGSSSSNGGSLSYGISSGENIQEPLVSTRYSRHRPNTHQKHSHYDTMTNLNSAKFGRSNPAKSLGGGQFIGRHSMLTESDVMILTVASIAMTIMSFLIMGVCLFKYKLDKTDEEQILSTHSKLIMSRALFTSRTNISSGQPTTTTHSSSQSSHGPDSAQSSKHSSSRSKSGSTSNKRQDYGKSSSSDQKQSPTTQKYRSSMSQSNTLLDQQTYPHVLASMAAGQPMNGYQSKPPTIGGGYSSGHPSMAGAGAGYLAPVAQNFLMRSPTIRKMHGLAGNASDWFKYTLRAYPSASGSRRRRLFIQNNAVCSGPSQLSTSRPTIMNSHLDPTQLASAAASKANNNLRSLLRSGCPIHAFKCLKDTSSGQLAGDCEHCTSLLLAMQQDKYPAGARQPDQSAAPAAQKVSPASSSSSTKTALTKEKASSSSSDENNEHNKQRKGPGPPNAATTSTFQATIEQSDGGFMPPKMIQALAKRLDEQASGKLAGRAYSRDQQVKAMRTFGHKRDNVMTSPQSNFANPDDKSSVPAGVPSQIPTIDVDGRFTYQSDSNIDSPYVANMEQNDYDSRANTRGGTTPASTVATNQDDIFILVRDTPTSETTRESMSTCKGGGGTSQRLNHAASGAETGSQMTTMTTEGRSSVMNDECSRTSSPIAYGFMRSSPSATTLSSNTLTTHHHHQTQHYLVSRSPEPSSYYGGGGGNGSGGSRRPQSMTSEQRFHQSSNSSFKGQYIKSSDLAGRFDDNNNNNNYVNTKFLKLQSAVAAADTSAKAKPAPVTWLGGRRLQEDGDSNNNNNDNGDDHLIISRL